MIREAARFAAVWFFVAGAIVGNAGGETESERTERCAEAARLRNDHVGSARCFTEVSRVLLESGAYDESLAAARLAVEAARRGGDATTEASALNQLGDALFFLGRLESALESFHAALVRFESVGDRAAQALTLKNLGITYRDLGRPDQSMLHLERSLERCPDWQCRELSVSVLGNLGSLYRGLGAYRLAHGTLEEALIAAQDPTEMIDVSSRLGFLYLGIGFVEQARERFERALEIAEAHPPDANHLGWLLSGAGAAYHALGEGDRAVETYRRLVKLQRDVGNRPGLTDALVMLGDLLLEHDLQAARKLLNEAIDLAHSRGDEWAAGALVSLARAELVAGDLDEAIEAYAHAADVFEAFRHRWATPQKRLRLMEAYVSELYDPFIDALLERYEKQPESGDPERAFHVAERAAARTLLEQIVEGRLDTARESTPGLTERERLLRGRLAGLRQELDDPANAVALRPALIDELDRTELELDELVMAIRRGSPLYAALRYPQPLTLEQTQKLLDADTALVAYRFTSRARAFVVTPWDYHIAELPVDRQTLGESVLNHLELLKTGSESAWRHVGRRLYDDLLAPVRRHLGPEIRNVVIVPDRPLQHLPFEALIGPDGRFLIEEYGVAYVPSATVLSILQRSSEPAHEIADLLVFADPVVPAVPSPAADAPRLRTLYEEEGLELPSLPFSRREARIVGSYGGTGSRVCTGDEATEGRFRELLSQPFRVVHFATHGLLSNRRPERSALLLTPDGTPGGDGFLQAREISRLDIAADLVVLSACRTALDRDLRGAGIGGLAQAFFHAGARSVVGTLWEVDDRLTESFMRLFYNRLAQSYPKSEALRLAKLDSLSDPRTAAPAAWAGFVLQGDPNGIVPIRGRRGARLGWWTAGAGIAALLFTLVWTRRRKTLHRPR